MEFQHIVSNLEILGGKPCIRGTRISVQLILEWIANGSTVEEICYEFPKLSPEAVREAVRFAAQSISHDYFFTIAKVA